ncbi:MAG: hypothetical protein J6M30_07690 [Bacteroidales bacterium]|nr:hypothetical protein [Bacteroidales bacterium]
MNCNKKTYNLTVSFTVMLLCCLAFNTGNIRSNIPQNLNLNTGIVISYLQANNNVNSIDTKTSSQRNEYCFVINELRTPTYNDNHIIVPYDCSVKTNRINHFTLNTSIQNFSDRVLHPPLSKLRVLII